MVNVALVVATETHWRDGRGGRTARRRPGAEELHRRSLGMPVATVQRGAEMPTKRGCCCIQPTFVSSRSRDAWREVVHRQKPGASRLQPGNPRHDWRFRRWRLARRPGRRRGAAPVRGGCGRASGFS